MFKDDGPSFGSTGTPTVINVDETHLNVSAHANYGPLFDKIYGADGPDATTPVSFDLNFGIGPVGLVDEVTGEAITLSKVAVRSWARTPTATPCSPSVSTLSAT